VQEEDDMQTFYTQTDHTPRTLDRRASEPLLYRFEAQLQPQPVGLVPEGLLMANAFEGRVTDGLMRGARVWGIDHLLIRSDGVGVIDAPKTLSLGERQLSEHVRGYCLPPAGLEMPPLEVILSPGFTWPDVPFTVQATSTFRTGDPELSHLQSAIARIDGTVWMSTGRLVIETRHLPPRTIE
jgi:hypothetical protein